MNKAKYENFRQRKITELRCSIGCFWSWYSAYSKDDAEVYVLTKFENCVALSIVIGHRILLVVWHNNPFIFFSCFSIPLFFSPSFRPLSLYPPSLPSSLSVITAHLISTRKRRKDPSCMQSSTSTLSWPTSRSSFRTNLYFRPNLVRILRSR